jgi:hypothetical protein
MTVAAQKPVQRIFWLEGFIWKLALYADENRGCGTITN